MGKSSATCLKMITCAAACVSTSDESKASSGRPRWSFRKRSSRHRILSNSLSLEPIPTDYNVERSELVATNLGPQIKSLSNSTELSPAIAVLEVRDPRSCANVSIDNDLRNYVAVILQSAIRGCLARKELRRLKSVVKLQAAVRGHLVRKQAIGTLRCIHAIIRMQALVRARYARPLSGQEHGKQQPNDHSSASLEKQNNLMRSNNGNASVEKLLRNEFALQLLEMSSKTKSIEVKCDLSRPDSAWKWLERWMAVTSSGLGEIQNHSAIECSKEQRKTDLAAYSSGTRASAIPFLESSNSEVIHIESVKPTFDQGDNVAKTSGSNKSHNFLVKHYEEGSELEDDVLCTTRENNEETCASSTLSSHLPLTMVPTLMFDSSKDKHEINEFSINNAEREPSESSEMEVKRLPLGSRKACNPAFAAAQSKFEELSSSQTFGRPSKATYREASIESKGDGLSPLSGSFLKAENSTPILNSESQDLRVQLATSECGTEISISSTLDSPYGSEAEHGVIVLEIGSLERTKHANCINDNTRYLGLVNNEVREPEIHQLQEPKPVVYVNKEKPAEKAISEVHVQIENTIEKHVYLSSEISPRSHTTASESHGMLSSHTSDVKTMKRKKDDNICSTKQMSQAVLKVSPTHPNPESAGRSGNENLQKDVKNPKIHNSFCATKVDSIDHESKISSSNPLPSYMQATKSARAKSHASISPKSSHAINEKDNYHKKRHSLPMANGKQELSPQMQRSTSQVQQNAKGNSPHNSAERRWQR